MTILAKRIGARLREVRKERGLTQTQLAEIAGTTQPKISEAERGVMSLWRLHRLLDALEAEVIIMPRLGERDNQGRNEAPDGDN